MIIIGAGLSGLMAGCLFPGAQVHEAGPSTMAGHRAVLRFRSPAVGEAMGVEFRRVTVRKGIYVDGSFVQPNIALANAYSRKVLGRIVGDRSIWKTETVERWVAPEDLTERLADRCTGHVWYDSPVTAEGIVDFRAEGTPVVSTAPMPVMLGLLGETPPAGVQFDKAPIWVRRFRIAGADVHQTVYFPEEWMPVYRASITGDLLIVESRSEIDLETPSGRAVMLTVADAFGVRAPTLVPLDDSHQSYGKIAPIEEGFRRSTIAVLTQFHGVYSLGRFAVWKNILADDVLHDIAVIKRLVSGDTYARRLKA